jgi:hypothetical protein
MSRDGFFESCRAGAMGVALVDGSRLGGSEPSGMSGRALVGRIADWLVQPRAYHLFN